VRVWETASGREALALEPGGRGVLRGFAYSRDGRLLAAMWEDPRPRPGGWPALSDFTYRVGLCAWDVVTGEERFRIGRAGGKFALDLSTTLGTLEGALLAFEPDGTKLSLRALSGGSGTTSYLLQWDCTTGQVLGGPRVDRTLGDGKAVFSASRAAPREQSPDGLAVVVTQLGGKDPGQLGLVGTHSGLLPLDKGEKVQCVGFSPDSRHVAVAGEHGVRVWDTGSGEQPDTFRGHPGAITALCFDRDGTHLAGVGPGATTIWTRSGNAREYREPEVPSNYSDENGQAPRSFVGRNGVVVDPWRDYGDRVSELSVDGRCVALLHPTRGLSVLALPSRETLFTAPPPLGGPGSTAFSPDGRRLGRSVAGVLRVWELPGGRLLFERQAGPLTDLLFSPDGALLAGVRPDGAVGAYRTADGAEQAASPERAPRGQRWRSLTFTAEGTHLAGLLGARLVVWDADSGKEVTAIDTHYPKVYSAAFSPDGRVAMVSGPTNNIDGRSPDYHVRTRLLDLPAGGESRALDGGQTAPVFGAAFSPDSSRLVTVDGDPYGGTVGGALRLWDTTTGTEVLDLRGPGRFGADRLLFNTDGTTLLNGFDRFWDAPHDNPPQAPAPPREGPGPR
jgi:WD40 repeat protein